MDTCLQYMGFGQLPVWAPDGSALAVLMDNEIYIISIAGDSYRRLTDQRGTPTSFEWTPDSQFISYLKFANRKQTVSIIPRDGSWEKVVVKIGAFWNGEIAWSK